MMNSVKSRKNSKNQTNEKNCHSDILQNNDNQLNKKQNIID